MRNETSWEPSRILYKEHSASYYPNQGIIYPGSLHIARLQLEAYQPLIQKYCQGDLLDCGCGNMPYFDMYKEGTTSVTGVDWESTHGENKYADKVADLNEGIPFEESSFDSILCTDVIAHIFEPKNLFGDFSRVLRKDGYLVLTCPFFYWISEPPYEFYRYTEYAFRRFCEEAGLEVIHLQPYGGRKDIFLDLLNKKMTGKISNRIFSLLARIVGASSTNKYLETDTSRKFPLGYTLVAKKTVD